MELVAKEGKLQTIRAITRIPWVPYTTCTCTLKSLVPFHLRLVLGIITSSMYTCTRYAEDLDSSHSAHSIIYRHSDLDTSSVTGASCGATNQALQSRLIELQRSAVRQGVEGEREDGRRLFKRQQRDTTRIRCWLRIIADNK